MLKNIGKADIILGIIIIISTIVFIILNNTNLVFLLVR